MVKDNEVGKDSDVVNNGDSTKLYYIATVSRIYVEKL